MKTTEIMPADTFTVEVEGPQSVVQEGPNAFARFAVSREGTGSPTGTLTVTYRVVPGSASTADFRTSSTTMTVPGNIDIPVVDDMVEEGAETFSVELKSVVSKDSNGDDTDDKVVIGTATATATIAKSDTLTAKVSSQDTTVLEGDPATFVVELVVAPDSNQRGTSSKDIVIDYTVSGDDSGDSDAAEAEDYTPESGTLRIRAGQSTGTIEVRALGDDLLEPAEKLRVTLDDASPSDVVSESAIENEGNKWATTTIGVSGRTVTASMVQTAVTVTEGGEALFPVRLSGKVSVGVTVGYSAGGGDATGTGDDSDYESGAGALTIKAGETAGTITIDTEPDTRSEDDETFTVTLSDPPTATGLLAGSVVLGTGAATATIRDDDALTVTVEGSDRVVLNGNATYWFRLNGDKTGSADVTVEYMTNGSDDQTERTITAGLSKSANFMVGTGSLTVGQRLSVSIDDVSTTKGKVTEGSPSAKTTEIMPANTITVEVEGPGEEVPEGGSATFELSLEGTTTPTGTLTVTYKVDAGSASKADFKTSSTTMTVPGNIVIPVVVDMVAEGAETFSVELKSVVSKDNDGKTTNDKVVIGTATATATIAASDKLTAKVSSQDTTVLEGDPATFVVELVVAPDSNQRGTSSKDIVIDYTVSGDDSGDAAEAEDYTPESGTLRIRAGQSTGTIEVRALGDDLLEPAEKLRVTLDDASPSDVVSESAIEERRQQVGHHHHR